MPSLLKTVQALTSPPSRPQRAIVVSATAATVTLATPTGPITIPRSRFPGTPIVGGEIDLGVMPAQAPKPGQTFFA